MKNIFYVLSLLFCLGAQAKHLTFQDFEKLSDSQKVEVILEYKKFFSTYPMPLGEDQKVSLRLFSLIEEATAASDKDCFFAGWPSKVRISGGKKFCTSPSNGNPDYLSQSAKCSRSQMLCQPILFGDIGCIPAGTQAQKNMAFSSCEQKFKASGKTVEDVAKSLSDIDKRSAADEMFATVSSVCSGGFQASKPMCINLEKKVAAIKSAKPMIAARPFVPENVSLPTTTTVPVLPNLPIVEAVEPEVPRAQVTLSNPDLFTTPVDIRNIISSLPILPILENPELIQPGHEDCVDSKHGHAIAAVETTPVSRTPSSEDLKQVRCEPASKAGVPASLEELKRELEKNNVSIVTESFDVESLRSFVAEMRKFPPTIMNELISAKARVSLIHGNGVSQDPAFYKGKTEEQIARMKSTAEMKFRTKSRPELDVSWENTKGAGGNIDKKFLNTPTRIVVNHLYDGHGSSNLFLHEHAHLMDTFDGEHSISSSKLWNNVLNGPEKNNIEKLLNAVGSRGGYETEFASEGFVELFAHYHACQATQNQVKTVAPSVEEFFEKFTSLADFKKRESAAQ